MISLVISEVGGRECNLNVDENIAYIGISNSDGLQYVNTSTGSATYTNPTITGTTISNYTVVLTKPGDSVTLYFRIYNDGDINGEIESVISSTPVCTSVTGNTSDANLVCNNLDVSFTYFDNTTIRPGHILNDDDIICFSSGDDYGLDGVVKVHISLKTSMTSVPSSKVTISNLTHEIKFIQSDKVCDPIGIGGNSPI